MDLEILFWLVILLMPLLSRLLRGKKTRGGTPPAPPQRTLPSSSDSRPQELTPFEEALRQIQEALAEGRAGERRPEPTPERRPEPRAEPRPAPRREMVKPAPARLEKPRDEFRLATPPPAKPRFFDEKFDAAAPGMTLGAKEHYHEPLGEDIPAVAVTTRTREQRKLTTWQKALVDAALLGEPRVRKPWSPGRR